MYLSRRDALRASIIYYVDFDRLLWYLEILCGLLFSITSTRRSPSISYFLMLQILRHLHVPVLWSCFFILVRTCPAATLFKWPYLTSLVSKYSGIYIEVITLGHRYVLPSCDAHRASHIQCLLTTLVLEMLKYRLLPFFGFRG